MQKREFWSISTSFQDNFFCELEGKFLDFTKTIFRKYSPQRVLSGEMLTAFHLKSEWDQTAPVNTFIQHDTGGPGQYN